jgi:hypothetical protein
MRESGAVVVVRLVVVGFVVVIGKGACSRTITIATTTTSAMDRIATLDTLPTG